MSHAGARGRAPGAARRGGSRRGRLNRVRGGVREAQPAAAAGALPANSPRPPGLHGGGGCGAAPGGARPGHGAGERPCAVDRAGAERPDAAQLAGHA